MFEKYSKIRPGVFRERRVNECSNVFESSASLRMFYPGCSREHLAKRERRGWGSGATRYNPAQPGASDALT